MEWQRRDPARIRCDITPIKRNGAKLMALIGEWEAAEISEKTVVDANSLDDEARGVSGRELGQNTAEHRELAAAARCRFMKYIHSEAGKAKRVTL